MPGVEIEVDILMERKNQWVSNGKLLFSLYDWFVYHFSPSIDCSHIHAQTISLPPFLPGLSGCLGVPHGCGSPIFEERITPTRDFPVDEACDMVVKSQLIFRRDAGKESNPHCNILPAFAAC